jgi:hypothetical protein
VVVPHGDQLETGFLGCGRKLHHPSRIGQRAERYDLYPKAHGQAKAHGQNPAKLGSTTTC